MYNLVPSYSSRCWIAVEARSVVPGDIFHPGKEAQLQTELIYMKLSIFFALPL